MNAETYILQRLDAACRALDPNDLGDLDWNDGQLIRNCAERARRGDRSGWSEFTAYLGERRNLTFEIGRMFEQFGWSQYSLQDDHRLLTLPPEFPSLDDALRAELTALINPSFAVADEKPRSRKHESIMYIEEKPGLVGRARIGRVTRSATGKTIYYAGRTLRSLKGSGFKANYVDVESGLEYWISNCKRDGRDSLYSGTVAIDENAREEYWTVIRKQPDKIALTKFRSLGKHGK